MGAYLEFKSLLLYWVFFYRHINGSNKLFQLMEKLDELSINSFDNTHCSSFTGNHRCI